jgi:hypothetical protein
MNGLRMTRRYRTFTYWFRASFRFISKFTFDPLETLGVKLGLIKTRQRTLFWTKTHTHNPKIHPTLPSQRRSGTLPPPGPLPPPGHPPSPSHPSYPGHLPSPSPDHPSASGHPASPSIELTDYSTAEYGAQDTPAMAHSLFPPALRPGRPRNESDASFTEPGLPIYEQYRTSDDSNRSLIRRPSDVHRSRVVPPRVGRRPSDEREGRRSSDFAEQRSSSEFMLSPTSLYDEQPVFGDWSGTIHSRQGYQRANSDSGNLPVPNEDGAEGGGEGLGIGMDGGNDDRISRD